MTTDATTPPIDPAAWGDEQAEIYDRLYGECDVSEAVDALARIVPAGGRIIEAGCGTGRLVAPLDARGFRVLGLDASRAMLAKALDRYSGALFDCCDLGADPWPDFDFAGPRVAWDCVVFAFNTLGLLHTEPRQLHALVRACLSVNPRPGPSVLVQQFIPHEDMLRETDEKIAGGVLHVRADRSAQWLDSWIDLDDGRTFRQRQRFLYPEQLDALAARAGLELVDRWESFGGAAYRGGRADECVALYGVRRAE